MHIQGTDTWTGKPVVIYQEQENGKEIVELDGFIEYWTIEELLERVEIF